jgi:hypothetical protein
LRKAIDIATSMLNINIQLIDKFNTKEHIPFVRDSSGEHYHTKNKSGITFFFVLSKLDGDYYTTKSTYIQISHP